MTATKTIALSACFLAVLAADIATESPFKLGIFSDAHAVAGIARRHVVVGTAVVASSSANANAAATANANAAAATANANAAAANAAAAASKAAAPATPAGPPPVGAMVTTLPPGCAPTKLNDVEYMRCGPTYYKPSMMGTTLVFVVTQP